MNFIVAIDGPAGSGKSTVAKLVAEELNFIYIDTGAMYRMFTLFCLKNNIDINNKEKVIDVLGKCMIDIDENNFYINGENVTESIRTREVSQVVSKIAAIKEVRRKMVEFQREIAYNKKVILDGRDIGTVVFPNANLKIYLEASPEERAKRRLKDYESNGINVSYKEVLKEIIERDKEDTMREESPLSKAKDAYVIDSTKYTIDEVKNKIIDLIDKTMIKETLK